MSDSAHLQKVSEVARQLRSAYVVRGSDALPEIAACFRALPESDLTWLAHEVVELAANKGDFNAIDIVGIAYARSNGNSGKKIRLLAAKLADTHPEVVQRLMENTRGHLIERLAEVCGGRARRKIARSELTVGQAEIAHERALGLIEFHEAASELPSAIGPKAEKLIAASFHMDAYRLGFQIRTPIDENLEHLRAADRLYTELGDWRGSIYVDVPSTAR